MAMKREIRVAPVGVGNCASALVQGCHYYADSGIDRPGLMTPDFAGYLPEHLVFATAFDIDVRKVGRDLSDAIFAAPNCTARFVPSLDPLGCEVRAGYEVDSVGAFPKDTPEDRRFLPIQSPYRDAGEARRAIVKELERVKVEVVVNYYQVLRAAAETL